MQNTNCCSTNTRMHIVVVVVAMRCRGAGLSEEVSNNNLIRKAEKLICFHPETFGWFEKKNPTQKKNVRLKDPFVRSAKASPGGLSECTVRRRASRSSERAKKKKTTSH